MEDYLKKREEFVHQTTSGKYNAITFTPLEEQANKLFVELLIKERSTLPDEFYKGYTLRHKNEYQQNSRIFEAVERLPKGAIQHIHIDCCADIDWLLNEVAIEDTSYINLTQKTMKFVAKGSSVPEGFVLYSQAREQSADKKEFDENVRNFFFVSEAERQSTTLNIWKAFMEKINASSGLIYYEGIFPRYLARLLRNFIAQGVLHIEARSFLGFIFKEDGSALSLTEEIHMIREVIAEIKKEVPMFSLFLIIQGLKAWDLSTIEKYMQTALEAKKLAPELICGFDLVQEEDAYKTHLKMAPALLKMQELQAKEGVTLPFVFHGGESLHSLTNSNLFDVILFKTKRIGHGINLSQHSYLLDRIKEDEICLEICPVSNQILNYVDDIRLHPIKTFLNYGVKVSINPDDPSIFGYNGVNMDYFFVAIGTQFDFKDLKLCAYNSVQYSFLSEENKKKIWADMQAKYQIWAKWFIERNASNL